MLKLKAFSEDIIDLTEKLKFDLGCCLPACLDYLTMVIKGFSLWIVLWLEHIYFTSIEKQLQLIPILLNSVSCELHQYSRRMCDSMKFPKFDTRSQESIVGRIEV